MIEAETTSGKQIRGRVSRSSQGEWQPSPTRRDPIEILEETGQGRIPELLGLRYQRMAQSPFTFLRGGAAIMAEDLANTPSTDLLVQACGDCHLMNFGGYATPERSLVFDLNDFDETIRGAWEWDLKRLVSSFFVACRDNRFSDAAAGQAAAACARSYRVSMRRFTQQSPLDTWYFRVDRETFADYAGGNWNKQLRKVTRKALSKTVTDHYYPRLTETTEGRVRLRDNPPLIYHLPAEQYDDFGERVEQVLATYRQTLPEERRVLFDRYEFIDAAMKVVGVGSVGTYCAIALMMAKGLHPLLLQIKQARRSVLEPHFPGVHSHQGERVVVGQRLMQAASDIFLGWTEDRQGRHFYLRQLRDVKISANVASFDEGRMGRYAALCGLALARAHARSGDADAISGYLGRGEAFDLAMARFAAAYAEQTEQDHARLQAAIASGRLPCAAPTI